MLHYFYNNEPNVFGEENFIIAPKENLSLFVTGRIVPAWRYGSIVFMSNAGKQDLQTEKYFYNPKHTTYDYNYIRFGKENQFVIFPLFVSFESTIRDYNINNIHSRGTIYTVNKELIFTDRQNRTIDTYYFTKLIMKGF